MYQNRLFIFNINFFFKYKLFHFLLRCNASEGTLNIKYNVGHLFRLRNHIKINTKSCDIVTQQIDHVFILRKTLKKSRGPLKS